MKDIYILVVFNNESWNSLVRNHNKHVKVNCYEEENIFVYNARSVTKPTSRTVKELDMEIIMNQK